jgi:prepilin-type N-terminal cleavage/methylation domain-containing protein/prepilin-type processing-associated H-X9-DG protein
MVRMAGNRRAAFTLIELLVVVAIISLLISILLPSLNGAKRVARRVVCGSNQRQLATAMRAYGEENDEWIVGAPNGSGFPAWEQADRPERVPTTVFDWANPSLRYLGIRDMHPDRITRMARSRKGIFKCPDSKETMIPFQGVPAGHPDAIQEAPSYLTNWKFMFVGANLADPYNNGSPNYQQSSPYQVRWMGYASDWETELPRDYTPRLNKVGLNSRKIFLMDGARFVTDEGVYDYDARLGYALGAGSYSSSGPSYRNSQEYGENRRARPLSYRHPQGTKLGMNAVFFDGHVEYLSESQSHYLPYSTPTGSRVRNVASLHPDNGGYSFQPPNNIVRD